MNKHIVWIDNAKLLAMFLVLFEHHGLENRFVSDWIWTFHLAAFFFISGIFASSKPSFSAYIKSNFYRLIVPVVLWHIIGSVLWQPVLAYIMTPSAVVQSLIQTQIDFFSGKSCGFGWFMICLFWMKCEFWLLHRISLKCLWICGFIVFPITAYFIADSGIVVPFYLVNSLMAFPFFLLGNTLSSRVKCLQLKPYYAVVLVVFLVMTTMLLCQATGRYSLNSMEYHNYPALIYVQGVLGTFIILLLSYFVRIDAPILRVLGGGTIVLLLIQPPFIFLAKAGYRLLAHPSHPAPYFDVVPAFISSVMILFVMYPMMLIINKYAPLLNGNSK